MCQTGRDHGGKSGNRAPRQINARGDDDLCHANGNDADDGDLQNDDDQAFGVGQKALTDEDPAQNLEQGGNTDQHQKDAEFLWELLLVRLIHLGWGGRIRCSWHFHEHLSERL